MPNTGHGVDAEAQEQPAPSDQAVAGEAAAAASSTGQGAVVEEPAAKGPEGGKETRKALSLLDGIAGGAGIDAIVSFPGLFQEEWNEIVATADLVKRLDPDRAFFSTACIFLPDGDENFGKHIDNDVDEDGKCFCFKLYGERKEWGCKWFGIWRNQLLEILRRGQLPVVVYKAGQVGQGDQADWDDFPIPFTTSRPGLGGSQAGEVALLKMYLRKRGFRLGNGKRFLMRDVKDVSKEIASRALWDLHKLIRGPEGPQKLASAIEDSHAVQQGLRSLDFYSCNMGQAGAKALAKSLGKLKALRVFRLYNNNIGEDGARALAEALAALTTLERLNLESNGIGEAGAVALAEALPKLTSLQVLELESNGIGKAGARALAGALPSLAALEDLQLGHNGIGKAGAEALATALPKLTALRNLQLDTNNIGEVGAEALAEALPQLTKLTDLGLGGNRIGEAGALALAQALPHLTALQDLRLTGNHIGEAGAVALAEALPELTALRRLGLSGNRIGEEGAKALAGVVRELIALERIELGFNEFGKAEDLLLRRFTPRHVSLTL